MREHTNVQSVVRDKDNTCYGIGDVNWRTRDVPRADGELVNEGRIDMRFASAVNNNTHHVTVCVVPTFQTDVAFGARTGGAYTSRASISRGAAATKDRK